jgi:hypothetical protein
MHDGGALPPPVADEGRGPYRALFRLRHAAQDLRLHGRDDLVAAMPRLHAPQARCAFEYLPSVFRRAARLN